MHQLFFSDVDDLGLPVQGFSIKIKTEEGNLDWVFNNTPVFFLRDPAKFPTFIHTQKRDPQTHLKDADAFWVRPDFTISQSSLGLTGYVLTGLLVSKSRVHPSGHDPLLRPWNSRWVPQHAWVLRSHLQIRQGGWKLRLHPDSSQGRQRIQGLG